ncbi:SGNH/GDSL hydrolase family protein [Streptomyces niveiscabiei]|uniref:SGNH/GDSL hydrolase family protein n=1 Tax=Streptomyces niveiscabiei TaxID=164115 RepID=UPI0029AA0D18|nr:SGNH/GDSL hydrolase family protein [Streptomyces niveiscabiei]MDX3387970.1 SGNH/GDSL hydrolase family protein [Streptomyces niveiscabiei]
MTTHLRLVLAGLIVASGTLTAAVAVTHDDGDVGTASMTPSEKGPYVALGDSCTAGPKIRGQTRDPAGCDRSDRNYPSYVVAGLGLKGTRFKDVSCSGATLDDLTGRQSTEDGTNAAQLTALSEQTRLVTIGVGGNDIGFSSMIKRCVGMGALHELVGSGKYISEDAPCARQYGDDVQQKIEAAGERLSGTLGQIRRRAPEARVYVVGYPAILPSDSAECGREIPLAPGDVSFLRKQEQRLNTELRGRAEAAGMKYVDTYTPSEGHDACSAEGARWMADAVLRTARGSL